MTRVNADFTPFAARMRAENLPDIVIRTFEYYYNQLVEGRTGLLPEADILPVEALPDTAQFGAELAEAGRAALPQTILLKLNGGLGTGMGLERAKSLLIAKDGLTFLDIIARQALISGAPLVLMNSFNTRDDSLAVLARYKELARFGLPLDFVQHKVPKIVQADLTPAVWPADPDLEWCPPGHGDIYTALQTSGMLDALLAHGYRYAFVSNADNLGAVLEPAILGYFVTHRLPFLMEVADRTEADRKGGHLARRRDGRLILRESAQCPAEDMPAFQDIGRHRYFNTNNLWLDLAALQALLRARGGILGLPMIRNRKPLDPRDPSSPSVYQLETAMGAAIELFEGAGAVRVPRTRFAPVKTTDDLLAVRSDAYLLTEGFQVIPNPARQWPAPPVVCLDPRFYRLIDDLEARFPFGPPSLVACERLIVRGDVRFGRDVACCRAVEVINEADAQAVIADGTTLCGVHRVPAGSERRQSHHLNIE
ncbi:MAG: UTP--glucose-1-phosphate uridylyltransferase [Anaerolineae bacterium]